MICELFPFQKQAVNEMRLRVAMALNNYRMLKIPQVVSLQAPTGSGKTIIMSALIEDIFYGSEQFTEQPEAIFVWLSDSPQLNEQSKQKIELKADKIRMDQCVVISDESFDREILEDGHIYFLNTQKLGKAGNLSRHSDTRQYTIWETIENTAREKADRLYFIIDEAHRGMQGRQAGTATTIMQRFINGFQEEPAVAPSTAVGDMPNSGVVAVNQGRVDSELPAEGQHQTIPLETVPRNDVHAGQEIERTSEGDQSEKKEQPVLTPAVSQMSMLPTIDREGITKFINEQGYLTYIVRAVKINSYLKSLMSLAGLLSQFNICITAAEDVKNDVAELIRNYVNGLHDAGKYDELTKQVMEMKLSVQIFDVFGEKMQSDNQIDMFTASESDLDRQLRVADAKMGGCGFHLAYGRKYIDFDNPNAFKVDCILFAFDSECIAELNKYAEKKFHELNDQYRKYIVAKPEKCQKQYSDIVANGDEISKHNFTLPETISAKVEADGIKYTDHLFANADGIAKIKLNGWEQAVLAEEQKREDYVCWLRNPSRQSWSLRMPYEMDGKCKELYPDFIIVRQDPILKYIVDILEPHNPDFKDNLGKAKGLANYAANEPRIGRVQLIRIGKDAAGENRFKRLDLAKGSIRNQYG